MMDKHLGGNSEAMFKTSGDVVKANLESMMQTVEAEIEKMTSDVYRQIARDYSAFHNRTQELSKRW